MNYDLNFHWVWKYRQAFLNGLWVTIELNTYAIILATLLGLLLALASLSNVRPLRAVARVYIDLFRALPLLVLMFWLFFAFPLLTQNRISLGSFAAALIALTLNLSAFVAEIVRAGILAVPGQQIEAARSLGFTKGQILRHVTLPIGIRQMIPPLTGQYINSVKLSVLASVIAVPELLHTVQTITTEVFRPIEMYSTLAAIFLVILLPGTWLLYKLEKPAAERKKTKSQLAQKYAAQPLPLNGTLPSYSDAKTQRDALVIEAVCQSYNGLPVLHNVSFKANAGQVVSIIGPNGSGKTTLLRATCGFLPLISGNIRLGDRLLTNGNGSRSKRQPDSNHSPLGTEIGLVSQMVEPWPHLTVFENVALPLTEVSRIQKPQATEIARQWLDTFGISSHDKRYAKELSGGLKQRVTLARTLAMNPRVLLFDEVTSALDPEWSAWVRDLMRALANEGKIIINVSHKLNLVREVSDWVVFLNQGYLVEEGPPAEILNHPKSEELKLFLSCS